MSVPGAAIVRPLPGDGLVGRDGGLSLACALPGRSDTAAVDGLLTALAEAAAAGESGHGLVSRTIRVLAGASGEECPSACAVAGPAPDGAVAVLVAGAAEARVLTADGREITITGPSRDGWTERLISGPVARLDLRLPGAGEVDPRLRLTSGVVRAGGLRQITQSPRKPASPAASSSPSSSRPSAPARAPAPSPSPSPSDAGGRAGSPAQQNFVVPLPATRAEQLPTPPKPSTSSAPSKPRGAPEPQHVLGVNCKNHHFNDPRARYCAVCGISMMQATLAPFMAPRPPLGVLLVDDGQTVPLTTDVLIGRDPRQAPGIAERTAIPMRLTDDEGSISRRHTLIQLDGWKVRLVDLGSVNGTAIKTSGAPDFERIAPETSVPLAPGTAVRIGVQRTFRFESNREA